MGDLPLKDVERYLDRVERANLASLRRTSEVIRVYRMLGQTFAVVKDPATNNGQKETLL